MREKIDEIVQRSPHFKGYVERKGTTAWFLPSKRAVDAVKKVLGRHESRG